MNRERKFRVYLNEDFNGKRQIFKYTDLDNIGMDIELHPEAIIQDYIGLKDKNNKDIYEGDILKIDVTVNGNTTEAVVFDFGCFWPFNINGFLHVSVEVIGNICENPRILNEK